MAVIREPQKALPIAGFIFTNNVAVEKVVDEMTSMFGQPLSQSKRIQFTHTEYYNEEMGGDLLRQWYAFNKLVDPAQIVELKHATSEIERHYLNDSGGRQVNIDPGLISMNNLVLASTKNYSHRIYLGKGIYAEITLIFRNKSFHTLEWTYPDYREQMAIDFFENARSLLKEQLAIASL